MNGRPLLVTTHAVCQYRDRNNDSRSHDALEREIADTVRVALAEGRIANHKRNGFLLYGQKRKQLPEEQRFVWSEDESVAWIVKRKPEYDVVVTTLTRAGAAR